MGEDKIWLKQAGRTFLFLGDDIGWWNINYNNRDQTGYWTPNIDRIGHEGVT
jgi:hypothetical protein